jgi:uncharacterized protein (TIGR04222 family)
MALAAAGDTWGIPGPSFLGYFIAAVLVVSILSALHRRALFAGRADAEVDRLGPQQIAYLNGRERLAVYTAIGGLRAAEAIGSGPDKTLVQTGPLPAGATPLDTAVYNAAGRRVRAREVNGDQWVVAALTQLREGLEASGLTVTAAQRRAAGLWSLAGVALIVLGAARLVAGVRNDRPVGFLFPAIVFAIIFAALALVKSRAVQTRAAAKALKVLRMRHVYLDPSHSPSYATYGAAGAAMGVALYGAASLYAMDPAFAAEAEIQRISASGGATSWTGDGGATAGSGGSCSGSSSCGGGGGCGGGGCGG